MIAKNALKTTVAGLALLALAGAQHAVAQSAQGEPTDSLTLSWNWAPSSVDDFLNGVVGNQCQGGTNQIDQGTLEQLFPLLVKQGNAGNVDFKLLSAVGGCDKHCTCGACLVIDGQVACTACYACCDPGDKCDSDCSSDLANQIVKSSCDCIPGNKTLPLGRVKVAAVDTGLSGKLSDVGSEPIQLPGSALVLGRLE
jgi:hypothetical protein